MIYHSEEMETRAALEAAARVCAAARTAPKACGVDRIHTLTLTDADKDAVAREMERLGGEKGADFFIRDAGNVRAAKVLVLIGIREAQRAWTKSAATATTRTAPPAARMAAGSCTIPWTWASPWAAPPPPPRTAAWTAAFSSPRAGRRSPWA